MTFEKPYYKLGDLDINDGKVYSIQDAAMDPPALTRQWSGANVFRDGEEMVDSRFSNRTVALTLAIQAASESALRDAIRDLYAEVYAKDTNELEYRPLGCSSSLYFDTFKGEVSVPAVPDGMWADYVVENVLVTLPAKPFARGDEVTLYNLCKNAGMDRDANGDGTPDNWGVSGNITPTVQVAAYKYAPKSCHLAIAEAEPSAAYLGSDNISISASTAYVLTGWAYVREGALYCMVYGDVSGALGSVAVGEEDCVDPHWVRFTLAVTTGAGDSTIHVRLGSMNSPPGELDAFVDGIYVGQHSAAPDGWCSHHALTNHTDDDAEDVNYFDVADLPGDVPAGCAFAVNDDNNQGYIMRWGKMEGDHAHKFTAQWEAEDFVTPAGFLTEPTEASASGAYYVRFTPASADDTSSIDFELVSTDGTWEQLDTYRGTYYVYVRCRVKSSARNFAIKMSQKTYSDWQGDYTDEVDALPMDEWGLVNLGKIEIPPTGVRDDWPLYSFGIELVLRSVDGAGTLDIDYIWLMPAANGGVASFPRTLLPNSFTIDTTVDPPLAENYDWNEVTGDYRTVPLKGMRYLGAYPTLKPNSNARFLLSVERAIVMDYDNLDAYNTDSPLKTSTTYEYLAQKIWAWNAGGVRVLWLYLKATGTFEVTDTIQVEIQSNSGGSGEPSGSPITNGVSDTVDMDELSTSDYAWVAFSFSTAPSLEALTTYHIVLKTNNAVDASNYVTWGQDTDGNYLNGNCETYDSVGAAWTQWTDYDYLFKMDLGGNILDDSYTIHLMYEPRYLLVP